MLELMAVALALSLPAESFFVGDPGVKLIAARNAAAHPASPLEISLPVIGAETNVHVDPFFVVHGDHAHALTSEVFPLLSAPFIAAAGIRGAYLLPVCGFLLSIFSCVYLAAALDLRRNSSRVLLGAVLGTPLLFYGLEFWEHAPAVGLAALATTIIVKSGNTEDTRSRGRRGRALVAGLLYGIAILLRPEAAWFFLAVAASSRLLPSPPGWPTFALAVAGIALALAPLVVYSIVHFGTLAPPHVETQAALLTQGWLDARAHIVAAWFVPFSGQATPMWGLALVGMTAVGSLVPGSRMGGWVFLVVLTTVDVVLVALTAPNDGGGQWGPRYLLFAFVPASVLIAGALQAIPRQSVARTVIVIAVLVAGVWVQRAGYRELRGTKNLYGRVLDLVRQQVPAGGYAVTDLWWLDQVAAAATSDRTMLFVPGTDDRRNVMHRLHAAGVSTVTAFVSRDESPDIDAWNHGPCYEPAGQTAIEVRNLVAITLRRLPDCDAGR